ncbi:hypothetical protein ACFLU8_02740 [Chloroflexota bacterium]
MKAEEGEISADDLLAATRECCSKTPGFITRELPILESVFRLFLANGNQPPPDMEKRGRQLNEWRGGNIYCTSAKILPRLISNDRYYGLRQVQI